MGRNRSVKRQNFEKREEEKAILMIVGYTLAS